MNRRSWETNPENVEAECDGCGAYLKYGGYADGEYDWCGACANGEGLHRIYVRKLKEIVKQCPTCSAKLEARR